MSEYVAIFCPHCGQHINEVEEQDTPEGERTVSLGSLYTCGWCKLRTQDWNHVLRCRRTWEARAEIARRQAAVENAALLRRTRIRLMQMIDTLEQS